MGRNLILQAVTALTLISCQRAEFRPSADNPGSTTITALAPDGTRTELGPRDGNFYPVLWTSSDAISVNGQYSSGVTLQDGGATAQFAFSKELSAPYFAVCPAGAVSNSGDGTFVTLPATQTWKSGSFDPTAAILLAKGTGDSLRFNSATAFLKLSLAADKGVISVKTIKLGAKGSALCGKFKVDFDKLQLTAQSSADTCVTLQSSWSGTAENFIIAIPAGVYNKGMGVEITDGGNNKSSMRIAPFTASSGKIYLKSVIVKGQGQTTDSEFTGTSAYGVYDITDEDHPLAELLADDWQYAYGTPSSGCEFRIQDFAAGKLFSIVWKDDQVSVTAFGFPSYESGIHKVTCLKKTSGTAWLRDDTTGKGYIIPING